MKRQLSVYEKKSWQLVALCWAAYTTVYIGRKNLSVCLSDMTADGVITPILGGTIGTCFLVCYALGQLVNGCLGDRVAPRHMICCGLMSAGVCNLAMGLNSNGVLFCVLWGLCGISCSMLWSPIIRAVSTWTTEEISQSAAASLTATIPIGTVLCYLICAVGLKFWSWRAAFFLCGGVLCLASLILMRLFGRLKDHMTVQESIPNGDSPAKSDGKRDARAAVGIFSVGLIFAACAILFNGMLKDGLDLWIPTVLNSRFISSPSVVSLICTILPLFNIFGAYAARGVLHRFHLDELSTCGVMFLFSTVSLAIVTVILHGIGEAGGSIALAIVVTVLLALSSASMLGANTMLLTFIPLHYGKIGRAATVTGILNSFSYGAAAVSSIAIGSVSETFGWEAVFIAFVAASALGVLFCLIGHPFLRKKTDELDRM